MRKLMAAVVGVMVLGFAGAAHADFVGNKDSKFFFPDTCSYAKLIKKENQVPFKTSADAVAAGYKVSSKCKADDASTMAFVGNKSSKLFFPADCSVVKMIKAENKVDFKSSADALAAGYKASSKCSDDKK
jgi:methylphosphotriester-DNA--protein-cysteine methyltransferase